MKILETKSNGLNVENIGLIQYNIVHISKIPKQSGIRASSKRVNCIIVFKEFLK
jgi:hypothetical protein